jgi:catechol 2,3-dioxygenase-like lactoylglutathione lyase family enzyme
LTVRPLGAPRRFIVRKGDQSVHESGIITPVSRLLGATDLARTSAFYQDVLAFEVLGAEDEAHAIEVVSGKARIRFGRHDHAPNHWDEPRPIGSAIVFFEVDNVEATHAAIRQRGGRPSALEDVNALKMRVFEIRDPDGHTLWFGQSFDEPDKPAPKGLLEKIMPELPLSGVAAGVTYYRDVLGFRVNYEQADLGVMDRDEVRLLLVSRTERHKGIGSAYVYVNDADALCVELRSKGAHVQGNPVSQPWGLREFRVLDLEGNQITFGQPFE